MRRTGRTPIDVNAASHQKTVPGACVPLSAEGMDRLIKKRLKTMECKTIITKIHAKNRTRKSVLRLYRYGFYSLTASTASIFLLLFRPAVEKD